MNEPSSLPRPLSEAALRRGESPYHPVVQRVTTALHNAISKSTTLVWLTRKAANQADAILARYYGPGASAVHNSGEEALLRCIGSEITTFVDVGAHNGDWTRALLGSVPTPPTRGLLFEPTPALAQSLRQHFASSSGLVEVVEAAAGPTDGHTSFFVNTEEQALSSILSSSTSATLNDIRVRMTTLDTALAQRNWSELSFLKIDAEGYDAQVLAGSHTILAEHRVKFLQFEYGSRWREAGATLLGVLRMLDEYRMETFFLRPDGLWRIQRPALREFYGYANMVAIRRDLLPCAERFIAGSR